MLLPKALAYAIGVAALCFDVGPACIGRPLHAMQRIL
jgi:hypothetical protein